MNEDIKIKFPIRLDKAGLMENIIIVPVLPDSPTVNLNHIVILEILK